MTTAPPPARPSSRERRVIGTLVAILLVGMVAILVYGVLALTVLDGEVTGSSLAASVGDEAGSTADLLDREVPCSRTRRAREWSCQTLDGSGSVVTYRVRVDADGSCWTGRAGRLSGEPMPLRIAGCIPRWQLPLGELQPSGVAPSQVPSAP